jgi:NAD+ kinase
MTETGTARAGRARTAVLFVNLHKPRAGAAAEEIRRELEGRRIAVTVFAFEGKPAALPRGEWDVAFSLGGDGTVLYTARSLASAGIPIFPVNLGTLGFIAGVTRGQWLRVFEHWLNGAARISRRCMLELAVERGGAVVAASAFLNDAVVSASGIAKLIRLEARVEIAPNEYAGLGCYRSDGLIIATPTGSTAYSMAAGGPILDPEMEALILSPICPFTLGNRPLVLPSRQSLVITVAAEQRSAVLLTVDGQDTVNLEPEDRIVIRQAAHPALLISADRGVYYSALRDKLAWPGGAAPEGDTDA